MKKDKINMMESIVIGGGCFWCLEAVYLRVKGVVEVISGYAGGVDNNPTYEKVSTGETGHAEVVKIIFNKKLISLEDILNIFFSIHDPTTLNLQGGDIGSQYRSIILYDSNQQRYVADKVMRDVALENIYGGDMIVTELKKLKEFYPAEDRHQKYFAKNPQNAYCQLMIAPKVAKFREKYGGLYIENQ